MNQARVVNFPTAAVPPGNDASPASTNSTLALATDKPTTDPRGTAHPDSLATLVAAFGHVLGHSRGRLVRIDPEDLDVADLCSDTALPDGTTRAPAAIEPTANAQRVAAIRALEDLKDAACALQAELAVAVVSEEVAAAKVAADRAVDVGSAARIGDT